MKTISNTIKYFGFAFAAASLGLFLAPSPSFAEEKTAPEIINLPKICNRVDEIVTKVDERITKLVASREAEKIANAHILEEEWAKEDTARLQARADADLARQAQIDALMQNANTDGEKTAVTEFAKALDDAITELRTSTDTAIDTYHKSVLEARDARTVALDKLVADYKLSVEKELTLKKTNCGNTVTPVRELELKNNLESMRIKFNKDIVAKDTITTSINKFAKIRKDAITKAEAVYKKSVKSATDTLKSVLQ